ncbi:MAG: hypothetical protein E6767_16815 [Dysgonomonas sp.]|nr:hypothetical protein [Dysgonomonas sp.]
MKDLNSSVSLYKAQLKQGDIQIAYKALIRYTMSLKSHLARTLAETFSFGNVSLGYLDYTYFYCIDSYLREKKLRFCIVLNHEKMRFELWLVGQNSEIQKKYWNILKDTEWNKHQTSMPKYSVLEYVLMENPDFNNLKLLTNQIEKELISTTNEVIEYLKKGEPNMS